MNRFPGVPVLIPMLAWATLAAAGSEFQTRCETRLPRASYQVTVQEGGYSVDSRFSYRALGSMGLAAAAGQQVLGLTKLDSKALFSIDAPGLSDPASGYECIAPHVRVTLVYSPMKVFVGREFPPGTCAYQAILEHEMRHVRTNQEHLVEVEKTVNQALARRFTGQPFYARRGEAQGAIEDEMKNQWLPWLQAELKKVEAKQALIDTPEEYRRLGLSCGGEVQRLMKGR
ncbi:MAG: hypothetical protein HGA47_00425 [Zoogloea sp.]|nr:hypothetical protein [Zoogloea sp.]